MAHPKSLTGKYLSGEMGVGVPAQRRKPKKGQQIKVVGAKGNNLKNVTAAIPLGVFTCSHGCIGWRQVDLPDRDALQGGCPHAVMGARENPAEHERIDGFEHHRQGHRHRPVADRAHAALQPGDLYRRFYADPRLVRRSAGSQGARLRAGSLLVQRQGRPLRGLPGRWRHQDRDALPAGCLCHLRRLQGQALQPRDAGRHLQGQVDRRRARHDGRGRRRVLQGSAGGARQAAGAGAMSALAISRSASRRTPCQAARRSASSSPRNCQKRVDRPHALHPG